MTKGNIYRAISDFPDTHPIQHSFAEIHPLQESFSPAGTLFECRQQYQRFGPTAAHQSSVVSLLRPVQGDRSFRP